MLFKTLLFFILSFTVISCGNKKQVAEAEKIKKILSICHELSPYISDTVIDKIINMYMQIYKSSGKKGKKNKGVLAVLVYYAIYEYNTKITIEFVSRAMSIDIKSSINAEKKIEGLIRRGDMIVENVNVDIYDKEIASILRSLHTLSIDKKYYKFIVDMVSFLESPKVLSQFRNSINARSAAVIFIICFSCNIVLNHHEVLQSYNVKMPSVVKQFNFMKSKIDWFKPIADSYGISLKFSP
jgi:transcription initiation factor TFIIIB Brf1 subunit/transcription initiation factor TFIIB